MPRKRSANGTCSVSSYSTSGGKTLWRVAFYYPDPVTGVRKRTTQRGFTRQDQALRFARQVTTQIEAGAFTRPDRSTFGEYLNEWLAGLRIEDSTRSSYDQKLRLHVLPYLADVPLQRVNGTQLSKLYRMLETSGRVNGKGGLSKRTVLYVHTIINSALDAAVKAGRLNRNPGKQAQPPSAKEARPPQMITWTADELKRFLAWCEGQGDPLAPAWTTVATTGLRRGELLGLRWSDVDLDGGRLSVRQQVVENVETGKAVIKQATKTGNARVVDLDPQTVAVLKAHRTRQAEQRLKAGPEWRDQGLLFVKASGPFGDGVMPGDPLHPERFSRTFQSRVAAYNRAAKKADDPKPDPLPWISIHDLRHTWASLALSAGVHPKVVQERLGHATISITLDIYSHVAPTMQREAAELVAGAIFGG